PPVPPTYLALIATPAMLSLNVVPQWSERPDLSLHDALPIYDIVSDRRSMSWPGSGPLRLRGAEVVKQVMRIFASARVAVLDNDPDRKSTRLISSHVKISYAVFCLKTIICMPAGPMCARLELA